MESTSLYLLQKCISTNIWLIVVLLFANVPGIYPAPQSDELKDEVLNAIEKGIDFYHSLNRNGGYVYFYSADMQKRWGEELADENTVEVQPPGTPEVGLTFLKAYNTTGKQKYLSYALETGYALVAGQNKYGGWDHTITFNENIRNTIVSFDDNQTQRSVEFLIALDRAVNDSLINSTVEKALNLMLESQLENGGWPHYYPQQGNYHDFATFNDGSINDCIDVMISAYKYYKSKDYLESIKKAGRFLQISQIAPPQSGWAQQYNEYLQPAWARSFEPPAVSPRVTLRNINSLLDMYLVTGNEDLLEPIPDAFRWVKSVQLSNGKFPRFVELYTNQPVYYDRGRIRVNSVDELSLERRMIYGYEQDLSVELDSISSKYEAVKKLGRKNYVKNFANNKLKIAQKHRLSADRIREILYTQDSNGRWLTKDTVYRDKNPDERWKGEFVKEDRISGFIFNQNVNDLCDYLIMSNFKN
ncbi:MAG: hypothetical protein JW995_14685 [Melioribacteraceae bacterium]|nr:hypothetical protein [Melioribacteraceae bacterium]